MSKGPNKAVVAFVAIMSLLLVLLLVADYAIGVRSDAMRFARAEVQRSEALQASIGEVTGVELRKLWGYGVTPGKGDEEARLSVIAVGKQGEKELTLHLVKDGGQWRIASSSEPL
jgi:hypothetical protein